MLEQREDAFIDSDDDPDAPVIPSALATDEAPDEAPQSSGHATLKYQLLGPSLTKAGQETVDQQKVCVSAT